MPCYMKYIEPVNMKLAEEIRRRAKAQGKNQVTKAITRTALKDALKSGLISTAKYAQLIALVDACVEEKGHVHEHLQEVHA